MRRQATHAGLHLSVRELLGNLGGIGETVLLHHSGGKGRPRAKRLLTDMTDTQQRLFNTFGLDRYAPHPLTNTPPRLGNTPSPAQHPPTTTSANTEVDQRRVGTRARERRLRSRCSV